MLSTSAVWLYGGKMSDILTGGAGYSELYGGASGDTLSPWEPEQALSVMRTAAPATILSTLRQR